MEEKTKNWLKENWFKLLAILFLLGALGDWPYSYYQLLRWVMMVVGAYAAYLAYNKGKIVWVLIFGILAVLFNPVLPFYLQKDTWQVIDVIAAILFFTSLFHKYERKS